MTCIHCARENPEGALYCKFCGEKHLLICPQCETVLDTDNIYCHMCGLKVEGAQAVVEGVTTSISSSTKPQPPTLPATDSKFFRIREGVLEKYTGKGLKSIVIPEGVEKIGKKAFHECEATEIILPHGLRSIEEEAFRECRHLTQISLPEGVIYIGDAAFFLCTSLKKVTLPNSLASIESAAFSFCRSLCSINLPDNLTYLGGHVFESDCSLEEIEIPSGITTLEECVFTGCTALKRLLIPPSVTLIAHSEEYASLGIFHNCENLTIVGAPDSVAETIAQEEAIPFEEI